MFSQRVRRTRTAYASSEVVVPAKAGTQLRKSERLRIKRFLEIRIPYSRFNCVFAGTTMQLDVLEVFRLQLAPVLRIHRLLAVHEGGQLGLHGGGIAVALQHGEHLLRGRD